MSDVCSWQLRLQGVLAILYDPFFTSSTHYGPDCIVDGMSAWSLLLCLQELSVSAGPAEEAPTLPPPMSSSLSQLAGELLQYCILAVCVCVCVCVQACVRVCALCVFFDVWLRSSSSEDELKTMFKSING